MSEEHVEDEAFLDLYDFKSSKERTHEFISSLEAGIIEVIKSYCLADSDWGKSTVLGQVPTKLRPFIIKGAEAVEEAVMTLVSQHCGKTLPQKRTDCNDLTKKRRLTRLRCSD